MAKRNSKRKRKPRAKAKLHQPKEAESEDVPIDPRTGLDARVVYERSGKDNVRCTFLYASGNQCKHPSRLGHVLCTRHLGPNYPGSGKSNGISNGEAAQYRFNTTKWDEWYQRCLNHPDWFDLSEEMALVRTAAQMTMEVVRKRLAKIETMKDEGKQITAQVTAAGLLQSAAVDVADIVEKAAKVQKLVGRTIDVRHIDVLLEQLALILHQEIEDTELLMRIALRIRQGNAPVDGHRPLNDWPRGSVERAVSDVVIEQEAPKETPDGDEA